MVSTKDRLGVVEDVSKATGIVDVIGWRRRSIAKEVSERDCGDCCEVAMMGIVVFMQGDIDERQEQRYCYGQSTTQVRIVLATRIGIFFSIPGE